MTRPAINPENIRRQQTGYKIRRTITRAVFWMAVAILLALAFVHVFDPALNPFI